MQLSSIERFVSTDSAYHINFYVKYFAICLRTSILNLSTYTYFEHAFKEDFPRENTASFDLHFGIIFSSYSSIPYNIDIVTL